MRTSSQLQIIGRDLSLGPKSAHQVKTYGEQILALAERTKQLEKIFFLAWTAINNEAAALVSDEDIELEEAIRDYLKQYGKS